MLIHDTNHANNHDNDDTLVIKTETSPHYQNTITDSTAPAKYIFLLQNVILLISDNTFKKCTSVFSNRGKIQEKSLAHSF